MDRRTSIGLIGAGKLNPTEKASRKPLNKDGRVCIHDLISSNNMPPVSSLVPAPVPPEESF